MKREDVEPDYSHYFTSAWSYDLSLDAGSGGLLLTLHGPCSQKAGKLNGIIMRYWGRAFPSHLTNDAGNTGSGGPRPGMVDYPYNFSQVTTIGYHGVPYTPINPSPCPSSSQGIFCWFSPAAFGQLLLVPRQQFASPYENARRGILRGPAQHKVDSSVFNDSKAGDSKILQFRTELFNFFSRTSQLVRVQPPARYITPGKFSSH